ELVAALGERTRAETSAGLVQRLRHAQVPCAPIQDVAAVARDPQVAASGMIRPLECDIPGYIDVAMPVRRDGERPPARRGPPTAGADTADVLAEIGMG
ncbi:MAG: CoA transferase, partial [Gemmatimonadetes bacterium]|nr:CoA transferase [Gemmatimonadota bacterium]NIQ55636.1 CoA transferase [Gemmatimonadota bacterium]NIU79853.1 CoA transferase [Gammaproteobacteria bacterium]NIX48342.1 CoA transferase [Gemmatimonadota bacterium]NIY12789.1 CoA transferase [Gemmatimonadota bacterium]